MTQDEIDSIPEMGGIGQELRVIDGKQVMVPVMQPVFALWQPSCVLDSLGQRWMVGTYKDVKYKSRMRDL